MGKDEQFLGTLHHTFDSLDEGENPTASLVVTTLVEQAVGDGWDYLGFRLEGLPGGDRYALGEEGHVDDPTLDVTYP